MKKKTINSILLNILWAVLSLLPFIVYAIFLVNGGYVAPDRIFNPNSSTSYILLRSGIYSFSRTSFVFNLFKSFLGLFGTFENGTVFLFTYVFYIQFLRIVLNLVFFPLRKCHDYLECFDKDDNNIL